MSRRPTSCAATRLIWTAVSASRMFCRPANSFTYRWRCFGDSRWNVPLCARLSIDQKLSTPFVWTLAPSRYFTYSPALCRTKSWSNPFMPR